DRRGSASSDRGGGGKPRGSRSGAPRRGRRHSARQHAAPGPGARRRPGARPCLPRGVRWHRGGRHSPSLRSGDRQDLARVAHALGARLGSGPGGRVVMTGEPVVPALAPAALQSYLRTAVFGHRVFYYPSIGSTNDRALDLADAGEAEGAIVLAEEQTGGRGRRRRTWQSPARLGIYVSVILRPNVEALRAPLFTFTAAVAVATALRRIARVQARIKWPNDVVVSRRKISGILAEARGSDPVIREMVLGIGINVNQRPEDFDSEVLERATSLRIETGEVVDRAVLLGSVLEGLEMRY